MTMQSAWFVSMGLQGVIFPYLLVDRLGLGAELVGIAQALIALPTFILMLPGGALADRFDGRSILIVTHLIATFPPLLLATILMAGGLSYEILLAYGIAMGTLAAFSGPARDSLLNRVVSASDGKMTLQRAVMLSSVFMFSSQIVGMILASQADRIGAHWVLMFQGVIILGTIWFIRQLRLPRREERDYGSGVEYHMEQMKDGLVEAFTHRQIMPTVTVALCIGIFYVGAFNVILPIQVRDFHGGGAWRFAMISIAFFSGTIISSMILFRRGGIRRAGRALTIAVLFGAVVQTLLSNHVPYPVLVGFVFLWGLGGGVAITMSRSIVQELAPESHRGRLLSVFSMGFMGGAPLGSFAMGYLIQYLDAYSAVFVPASMMLLCISLLVWRTDLWRITFPGPENAGTAENISSPSE